MTVAEDSSEEHGDHHLPAVEDWPRGFGEASWWPFMTAIGAAGIYVAAGLFVLSQAENPLVSELIGAGAAVASVGIFLAGIYGWLYHAFVVNFWERGTDHHSGSTLKFAMLLFLGSEVPASSTTSSSGAPTSGRRTCSPTAATSSGTS